MSAVYPKFREQLLTWALGGGVPASLVFRCVGVDATYVYNAAHNDLADVAGGSITIAEQILAGVTIVDGVVDANNVSVSGLDITDDLDAIIVYLSNGTDTYLAAYIDESADGSIPQGIDSTQGVISWHVNGIFRA